LVTNHFNSLATMPQPYKITAALLLFLAACGERHAPTKPATQKTVLRFEVDSTGNIIDNHNGVKQQLKEIAIQADTKADKFIIYSYTEQMGSALACKAVAKTQADAAKNFMMQFGGRVYYNIGIDLKGFEEPTDAAHPYAASNRRIEIKPVE